MHLIQLRITNKSQNVINPAKLTSEPHIDSHYLYVCKCAIVIETVHGTHCSTYLPAYLVRSNHNKMKRIKLQLVYTVYSVKLSTQVKHTQEADIVLYTYACTSRHKQLLM